MPEDPSVVPPSKKLYIKTYGCQMNVYDTERMEDVLRPLGYSPSDTPDNADLVILNTCHIREKAAEKVYSDLGRIRIKREEKPKKDMLIAVGGCVGQAEGEEIFRRAPFVDMVFGPQSYHLLPEMVMKAQRKQGNVIELEFPEVQKFDLLPQPDGSHGPAAFLSVQEGCDKFCTFCVVPYTRGAEYSRPVRDILREATLMVQAGVKEITLLGQNVNAFHGESTKGNTASLAELIRYLADIDGLERIRYTTSHPRDMDDDLIRVHGEVEKLMPYLHLPVQSGSDAILKRMNRKHTAAHYIDIIHRLREARPDIAMSSDFIVGFPGETEADFNDTMHVVQQVGYASAYSFKYSPRPGTPAATQEEQVPENVKQERLAQLQALINSQQQAFNQRMVGTTMKVLMEKPGKYPGQWIGRSPFMQGVHVNDADAYKHELIEVRITEAHANSLHGVLITDQTRQLTRDAA